MGSVTPRLLDKEGEFCLPCCAVRDRSIDGYFDSWTSDSDGRNWKTITKRSSGPPGLLFKPSQGPWMSKFTPKRVQMTHWCNNLLVCMSKIRTWRYSLIEILGPVQIGPPPILIVMDMEDNGYLPVSCKLKMVFHWDPQMIKFLGHERLVRRVKLLIRKHVIVWILSTRPEIKTIRLFYVQLASILPFDFVKHLNTAVICCLGDRNLWMSYRHSILCLHCLK